MIQFTMFGVEESSEKKYSAKIEAPVYEPKHKKPHIIMLCDDSKTRKLVKEIDESSLPEEEKSLLRIAATRHSIFNYEMMADYYSHASPEMQKLMEKSALVIVDFESAIEMGFVKLCEDIKTQFLEEYSDEPKNEAS